MTAPPKPWETSNRIYEGNPTLSSTSDGLLHSGNSPFPPGRQIRSAPPLPPRTHRAAAPRLLSSPQFYSSMYPGSYGPTSSYSGYGGFGSYGSGYGSYGSYGGFNSYGMNPAFHRANNVESRFIQMAEEGSRPAFQSIESIVQAFCSVSFMMESTFNAMYSSFRAVLGVAENFGQLRSVFGQFLSVFAIFRWLRWMVKKALYVMGLHGSNPVFPTAEGGADNSKKPFSWPVIFFLAIVFSGPYLMWKLLNSLNIPAIDPLNVNDWFKSKKPAYTATVLYDFTAASEQELSLQVGQRILIAPKDLQPRGSVNWLLACKGKTIGLVPSNYIQVTGRASLPPLPGPSSLPMQQGVQNLEEVVPHIPGPNGDKVNFCKEPDAAEVLPAPHGAALKPSPDAAEVLPAPHGAALRPS